MITNKNLKTARALKTPIRRIKAPVSIAIIGKGRLGSSYALAIRSMKQYTLFANLPARAKSFAALKKNGGPDILLIVCKDSSIKSVAKKAANACGSNLKLIVHSAGSLPSSILPKKGDAGRIMLHPLQTFAEPDAALFHGITFGMETADEEAMTFGENFAKALGAKRLICLNKSELPLYHAIAVIAANFITLLGGAIEQLSPSLELEPPILKDSLTPLMLTSLENVLKHNSNDILTGPIARNDKDTIAKHKMALKKSGNKAISDLYDSFHKLAKELK